MANVSGFSAVVVAVSLAGCPYPRPEFVCTNDPECGPGLRCEFSGNEGKCVDDDGPGSDGGDGAEFCYGATEGLVQPCFSLPPTGEQMLSGPIDTDSFPGCLSSIKGATSHCVIASVNITITGTVPVTGSRVLVLVATDTITISGILDAASKRAEVPPKIGPGVAGPSQCNAGALPTEPNGGGAGGTFVAMGGSGGQSGGTAGAGQPTSLDFHGPGLT